MKELSGLTGPRKGNGSRTRRYLLACIAFLAVSVIGTQVFLNITSVGSPRFTGMTFLLWTATFVIVLAILILATVLGRNLIKLYFERKSGQVGSGFKTKMVRTFIGLSLLPALLLFILAYVLISSSIQRWFSAPSSEMMKHSRFLAQQYYDEMEEQSKYFAASIAGSLNSTEALSPAFRQRLQSQLEEFRREYQLGNIRVFDRRGMMIASCYPTPSKIGHQQTINKLVSNALLGSDGFAFQREAPDDAMKEITWAAAPVRNEKGTVAAAVLTERVRQDSARFRALSVLEAVDKYEQLRGEEGKLRFNALLMLVLSTLLIVFAFSWFALYLAKRITVPIQALVQGAAAVAMGNLEHQVECQAYDELENLVASFNQMTSDLRENEKRIEAAQKTLRQTSAENADRRRYIETILQTIGTGVISIDSSHRVRTINQAAMQMLGVSENAGESMLHAVLQPSVLETMRGLMHKSSVLGTVVRNIELAFPDKTLQLAATVTPLVDNAGQRTGWVIVLDDMTELLRMEKMSAWQEVARRMAHEIKNPLTPIQLSAERILRRYRQIMEQPAGLPESWPADFSKFEKLLSECVGVIIGEAGSLKKLVDEFSRFSRLPALRLEDTDLNRILENALSLYDGRIQGISVDRNLDASIPRMKLDPEQMKRVFINLFDNALEAMSQNPARKELQLSTSCDSQKGAVRIEIGDTGCGFPEEYQDSVFLPYFSKRKGGTGLGLAIVRQIVSDHHGSVRAEANTPVGTRIIIDLPLAQA